MNRFKTSVIESNGRFYCELPFNVWTTWNLKGIISVRGKFISDNEVEFVRRLIPRGKGTYYLPITKGELKKLNNSEVFEIEIEPIENNSVIKHYEGFNENSIMEHFSPKNNINNYLNDEFYQMIFKRKSFHVFEQKYLLSALELNEIKEYFSKLKPLLNDIKTVFRIVPRELTSCKRGEYCILIYSEEKEHYLENVGYLGEQIDLFLTTKNIGVCWYGMGSVKTSLKKIEDNDTILKFTIMLTIEKVDESDFRKDYTKAKRFPLDNIWDSEYYLPVADVVRFTPSACNSQPWFITNITENEFNIFRIRRRRGIMPNKKVFFYNRIDIGIFILFLELSFNHINKKINFTFLEELDEEKELIAKFNVEDKNEKY